MKKSIRAANKFIDKCVQIEEIDAKNEDMLVYMSKIFMSATLPHSKPLEQIFQRKNGNHSLTLIANPQFGLPYGSLPRLILAWITKQVIRHKSPEINLGKTFSQFMKKLNFSHRSGGSRGDAARLREQMLRLFTTQISVITQGKKAGFAIGNQYLFTSSFSLWWDPLEVRPRSW
jgi:hypothetical protein